MKNYFKKFGIMFVMLLAIIGVGTIQNGNIANAATVGQQLSSPESGWRRFTYQSPEINYIGSGWTDSNNKGYQIYTQNAGDKIEIFFYGTKFRYIGTYHNSHNTDVRVSIDNQESSINQYINSSTGTTYVLQLEKLNLEKKVHKVDIYTNTSPGPRFVGIDIDSDGELLPCNESISLDQSSMDLKVDDSQSLKATTTPAAVGVVWKSSDESVAKYDKSTGKVIATGEGKCTITATIDDGYNVSASCTVNVIPKTNEPTEPQDPVGDGTLFIELVDGNIKSYDVSSQEITNFINWYKNRDLDDSQSPVYKFKKGDYTDYVVHDKIDWFEVR
ncbi:hypothetical protein LF65_02292 [Clostridium beijerinckii]|uniref:BIG2 domain-containing protein n=1 Tax=Clostridium beijerinckii TaxID=1520 RepID=A0A0B5QPS5_CLOBE|nr:Ig-like domain-containing protein [Clostridium beijerinckii]AJG98878.1 hypothetical protein LF65_02292 [Clostridium beijerinckii]